MANQTNNSSNSPEDLLKASGSQSFATGLQGDDPQGTDLQGGDTAVTSPFPEARFNLVFGDRKVAIPWVP